MGTDLNLRILASFNDAASGGIGGLARTLVSMSGAGGALTMAAAGLAVVGVAALGVGVYSIKMAADYQQAMLKVYALTGINKQQFDSMNQSLLAMAPAVGSTPTELAKALYYVASDGFRGAAALKLVELSAIGAKVGMTDTMTVAFALTSAIRSFGFADSQATMVMDIMNNTVKQGKMEWAAYAVQVGRLSTAAKTAGYSFTESNAALSTLTQSGSSAAKATTFLINLFNQMSLKTDAMAKHAAAAGISFDEVKFKSMSLGDQINYLTKITGGNATEMMKLMGNNSIAVRGYELLKDHAGAYATILNSLNHSTDKANNLQTAWAITQQGLNVQMDKSKAALDVLWITIGNQLIPLVSSLLSYITPLILRFADWVAQNHVVEKSLAAMGTAISNTVSFIQGMIAIGTSVVTFFQQNQLAADALGVAIGALGGVMVLFAASSVANMILSMLEYGLSILQAVATTVSGAAIMTGTFTTMSATIIGAMGAAAGSILATLGPFLLAGAVIAAVAIGVVLAIQHWGEISAWLQSTWSGVVSWFNSALQTVGDAVQAVINWFIQWQVPIEIVGGLILTFFAPALIKAGVEATIAGGKIVFDFVSALIMTGTQATVNGATITATFIYSMVETAIQAGMTAEAITLQFIASMFQAGVQAIKSAAQVTFSFVASLITTGIEGWVAAGKLVVYIGALIATGVQATIAGAAVAGQFIASVITSGYEAVIAGGKLVISYVGGMIAAASEAGIAATTLYTTIIPALTATGVAATAAAGVIGIAALAILAAVAGVQLHATLMAKNWSNDTYQMQRTSEVNFYNIKSGAIAHMTEANNKVSAQASSMQTNVNASTATLRAKAVADLASFADQALAKLSLLDNQGTGIVQHFGAAAMRVFDEMKSSGISDLAQLDASALSYLREIQGYVDTMNGQLNLVATNAASRGLSPGQINMHAEGTNFAPGGLSLIGEKGPELMYIPRGAQIIPSRETRNMMGHHIGASMGGMVPSGNTGGGGSVTVIIQSMHINDFGPNMPQNVANTITDIVATHLGSRMRGQYVGTSSGAH